MAIKRHLALLLSFLPVLASCTEGQSFSRKGFYYSQGNENDYIGNYYYSDSYFETSSIPYNPSLSTCSLSFALSCFGSNRNGSVNDYSMRYRNAKAFLEQNGFTDFETNSYYKVKPSADSLGAVYARKKIGDYTLIAAGVRGGNYEQEWASNFTLGDGKELKQHQGFYEASTIFLSGLEDYINTYAIEGQVKIWSVGYSRGGATNNLFSGRIDQRLESSEYLFGTKAALKREDLYSYCFEPPQGASYKEDLSPRDTLYNNIHNIVNFNDPVPKVARSAFDFTRYGVDHYLVDEVLNTNYSDCIGKVLDFYKNRDNYEALGEYKISSFARTDELEKEKRKENRWSSGLFLTDFLTSLVNDGVKSLNNYVSKIQSGLRTIFERVYRNGNPKSSRISVGLGLAKTILYQNDIDYLFSLLLKDPETFANEFVLILHDTLKDFGIDLDYPTFSSALKNLFFSIVRVLFYHSDYFPTLLSMDNIKALGSAHYPELCLAHLRSEDPLFTKNPIRYDSSGSYYILQADLSKEDSTLSIRKDSKSVLEVKDGSISEDSVLSCKIEKDVTRVILPIDGNYKAKIENGTYSLYKVTQDEEYPVPIQDCGEKTTREFTI